MQLRVLRTTTGALLAGSGALMAAASWQRWAGVCGWGDVDSAGCLERQDHRYDVLAPAAPWEPVGIASELAGASLLVLAAALVLLPWALTGRRPGPVSTVAVAGAAVGSAARAPARARSMRSAFSASWAARAADSGDWTFFFFFFKSI